MLFFEEFSESMANFEKGLEPRTTFEKLHYATLDWKVPVAAAILYAVIVTVWGRCNKAKALKAEDPRVKSKKSKSQGGEDKEANRFSFFNCLVIAHNVLLTVFSAYCFVCIVKILVDSYMNDHFFDAYCDRNLKQYYAGVNYLVWLFYLSKYYELLDTFILLLKGKPSSFLQTFHHSGSILSLWTMCVTRIPGMWIFTFLNSFIHTLMYYYFTLTCLGYRPKWKRHLTTMQITQFLVGNVLGIAYLIIPDCHNWDSNFRENVLHHKVFGTYHASIVFTFIFNFCFVGALILLFNDFARRTYGQKKAAAAAAASSNSEEVKVSETKAKATKSSKHKKESGSETVPAAATVKKGRKTSPIQIATSVVIEPEEEEVVEAKPVKKSTKAKASASRSKSRARSTVRAKSQVRAASPAKTTAAPATATRRSRRT